MASLVIIHAVVLEKKSKMSRPIKVHGGHLRVSITTKSNNTSSGQLEEHFSKFGDHPCSGSLEEVKNVLANQSMAAILDFRSQRKVTKLL